MVFCFLVQSYLNCEISKLKVPREWLPSISAAPSRPVRLKLCLKNQAMD